jgi:hypothetical protein
MFIYLSTALLRFKYITIFGMHDHPPKITYADTGQQTKACLLIRTHEGHSLEANPIWRRNSSVHPSAFFDLTSIDITTSVFKVAARAQIPTTDGIGMKVHAQNNKRLIEIFFSSTDSQHLFCENGISVEKKIIYGWASLSPTATYLKLKLTDLPFMHEDELSEKLKTLSKYGTVVEAGIFKSFGWFEGNGYALLELYERGTYSSCNGSKLRFPLPCFMGFNACPLHLL